MRTAYQDQRDTLVAALRRRLGDHLSVDPPDQGVETLEQLTKLRTLGCEKGQGFFFSRAISARDAENLLIDTKPLGPIPDYYKMADSLDNMLVA